MSVEELSMQSTAVTQVPCTYVNWVVDIAAPCNLIAQEAETEAPRSSWLATQGSLVSTGEKTFLNKQGEACLRKTALSTSDLGMGTHTQAHICVNRHTYYT